ncbi:MAG: hypothetical protein AVDCRST_MAG87-2879 [uncultured Thermomicrobiales bacterium]|uniref:Uncharacterized protein n=1 Tax=uncultured Thermomicrobiales bacterium TaxID=1645740 RepID=A0A6J4VDA6_9BACT|nr:MAG: hypothetical protein AVDCRST_MAG87-2879 [uncultured Thermomicrobiales bacterium]
MIAPTGPSVQTATATSSSGANGRCGTGGFAPSRRASSPPSNETSTQEVSPALVDGGRPPTHHQRAAPSLLLRASPGPTGRHRHIPVKRTPGALGLGTSGSSLQNS